MNKFQLGVITQVMNYTPEQAEILVDLMDKHNDHPDWSEFSDKQFRSHFLSVMAGE